MSNQSICDRVAKQVRCPRLRSAQGFSYLQVTADACVDGSLGVGNQLRVAGNTRVDGNLQVDGTITSNNPINAPADPSTEIVVATDGTGHFTALEPAVASAKVRIAGGEQIVIKVKAGTYPIAANPLDLTSGIVIHGHSIVETRIVPMVQTAPALRIQSGTELREFSIVGGPSAAFAIETLPGGVSVSNTALVQDMSVIGALNGIDHAVPDMIMAFEVLSFMLLPGGTGICSSAPDATLSGSGTRIGCIASPAQVSVGILADRGVVTSGNVLITDAVAALHVSDGGELHVDSARIVRNVTDGIIIPSTGGNETKTRITSSQILASRYDVFIDVPQVADFIIAGSIIDTSRFYNPKKATVNCVFVSQDERTGVNTTNVFGDLSVGRIDDGATTDLGSSGNSQTGFTVFQNDDGESGVWTDITAQVESLEGSTAIFFATNAGDPTATLATYIGSDVKFYGIYMNILSSTMDSTDLNNIAAEIWDGSAWVRVGRMATLLQPPYESLSNQDLSQPGPLDMDIRFGMHSASTWATKTLNGADKYWVRYAFTNTSASTNNVTLEQIRLITSFTRFGPDGSPLYYGDGRPDVPLSWTMGDYEPATSVVRPANRDMYFTYDPTLVAPEPIFAVGRAGNGFNAGQDEETTCMCIHAPTDIDTSCGLEVTLSFIAEATGVENETIEFRIASTTSKDGDMVADGAGSAPINVPNTVTTLATYTFPPDTPARDKQRTLTITHPLESYNFRPVGGNRDHLLWVALNRQADGVSSRIDLVAFTASCVRYTMGSHITARK